MKERFVKLGMATFIFLFCLELLSIGWASKIENYKEICNSIETMEGALEKALDASVISAYVPGFGSIFVCVPVFIEELGDLDTKASNLIKALGPLIQIGEDENVCVIIKYSGFIKGEQEYIIIAPKKTVTDRSTWQVFSTEGQK